MTKRFAFYLLFASVLILRPAASGQQNVVEIHSGFLTGQEFRELPELRKRSYAAGIIDGMFLAPLFDAPKTRLAWLENCVVGMTDEQMAAIISKYVADHPERWHERAHLLVYSALNGSCQVAPGKQQ